MKSYEAEHYLLKARLLWDGVDNRTEFPFSLPAISKFHEVEFHPNVTFLIGENGSGKSTVIEAIAMAWGFNAEGGSKNFNFNTHKAHSDLHKVLRLVKSVKRARDGFFLRAESYFNVATEIERLDSEPANSPPIIDSFGGVSLHKQSHGESFSSLLRTRRY